jgi:hypothetical protein
VAEGDVRFLGAKNRRDLDCAGGIFNNNNICALSCEGAKVKGDVFLGDDFNGRGRGATSIA